MTPLQLENMWLVNEKNNAGCEMDCDSRLRTAQEQVKRAREELTTVFHQL